MLFLLPKWRRKKRYMRPGDYRKAFFNNIKLLIALIVCHVIGMIYFEGKTVNDAVWLTWATFTTIGYGDMSAAVLWGRFTTMFFGTWGVITFAGIASNWIDFNNYKRELQRTHRWEWRDMQDHIVVIGLPVVGTNRYLEMFTTELRGRPEFADAEVAILAQNIPERENLPAITKNDDSNMVFYTGCGSEADDLAAVSISTAKWVIVLCPDPQDGSASDDLTSAIVYRLTAKMGITCSVIAEAALDRNMDFIKDNGATSVVRATNDFPGLIISEASAPGSYHINKDQFSAQGNVLNDYPVTIDHLPWHEVGYRIGKLGFDFRGYMDKDGESHRFGETNHVVDATKLYLLVPQGQEVDLSSLNQALAR